MQRNRRADMSEAEKAGAEAPAIVRSIRLTKPITAHGDKKDTLEFIEPTGADIADIGLPVVFDFSINPPRPTFDASVMTQMIAQLARVPTSAVRQMTSKDWTRAAWAIGSFFMPNAEDI